MNDAEPDAQQAPLTLDTSTLTPQSDAKGLGRLSKRPGFSSSAKIPALRLNRSTPRRPSGPDTKKMVFLADIPAPRFLRLWRLLIGLALLALAWGGLLATAMLAEGAWDMIPHKHPTLHLVVYVVQAILACWIGAVSLVCIVVGAFSLAIALTSRGWQ